MPVTEADAGGELPLEIQPKLLPLLQERTYEPIGDSREKRTDPGQISREAREPRARAGSVTVPDGNPGMARPCSDSSDRISPEVPSDG